MTTLLRPLASVGTFVFDCELSSATGETRDFSTKRIPTGESLIDHSVLNPGGRRWTLTGAVSQLIQPQNIGRPSPATLESALESLVTDLALGLVGQSTRLADAEDLLSAQIAEGDEVTVVSKKRGKFQALVTSWSVSDGPNDGGKSTYTVGLLEVQRASTLSFTNPGSVGESLNGSGSTTNLGATSVTDTDVVFTP